jgi:hypothetical protein
MESLLTANARVGLNESVLGRPFNGTPHLRACATREQLRVQIAYQVVQDAELQLGNGGITHDARTRASGRHRRRIPRFLPLRRIRVFRPAVARHGGS